MAVGVVRLPCTIIRAAKLDHLRVDSCRRDWQAQPILVQQLEAPFPHQQHVYDEVTSLFRRYAFLGL